MEYSRIEVSQADALWELQKAYKSEIEESMPGEQELNRLKEAIDNWRIAHRKNAFGSAGENVVLIEKDYNKALSEIIGG